MKDMPTQFSKNIDWLRQEISANLADKLETHTPQLEVVPNKEETDFNIRDKNTHEPFYENSFTSHIQEEFRTRLSQYQLPILFSTTSSRLENQPNWDPMGTEIHYEILQNTSKLLSKHKLEKTSSPQNGAYLVFFGFGIGYQIENYFNQLNVKSIIIYEPNIDLLFLSISLLNWPDIHQKIIKRGGKLTFIHNENPTLAGNEILHNMRGDNFHEVDGSYYIQHYQSREVEIAYQAFHSNINLLATGFGCIEDEIRMYTNTLQNISHPNWRILKYNYIDYGIEMPAFVVGSGPSLDNDIQFIKENRSKVTIFSCGTALSALIEHGIIPDFHCEVENLIHIKQIMDHLDPEILKTIPIICPTSVRHDVTQLFKETIYIFRDSITPTRLFFDYADVVQLASANVSCMATFSAAILGFKNIYLFGVDLGSISPKEHHSKKSIYMQIDDEFYQSGLNTPAMEIPLPSQRGNMICYTNYLYSYSLHFLNLIIHQFQENHSFFNGSNGARITGTKTVYSDQLIIDDHQYNNKEATNFLLQNIPFTQTHTYSIEQKHIAFGKMLHIYFDMLIELTSKNTDITFTQVKLILKQHFVRGETDKEHGLEASLRVFTTGTLLTIIQTYNYIFQRITSHQWEAIWPELKEEMHQAIQKMQEKTKKMFNTTETFN